MDIEPPELVEDTPPAISRTELVRMHVDSVDELDHAQHLVLIERGTEYFAASPFKRADYQAFRMRVLYMLHNPAPAQYAEVFLGGGLMCVFDRNVFIAYEIEQHLPVRRDNAGVTAGTKRARDGVRDTVEKELVGSIQNLLSERHSVQP